MSDTLLDTEKRLQEIITSADVLRLEIGRMKKESEKKEKALLETAAFVEEKVGAAVDRDEFIAFFKKPYVVMPNGKNSVLVAVPKFIKGFQLGWLWKETENYFIYEFNQYSAWLGDAPAELLSEINFAPQFNATIEGNRVTFDRKDKKIIKEKLGYLISEGTLSDNDFTIKKGRTFDIIAEMVKSGCLPFKATPVAKTDLRAPSSKIVPRSYQQPAVKEFLLNGAIGTFQPTGAGKSFIAMYIADIIVGKKLLFVPNTTLKEQWHAYIEANIPQRKHEIAIHTYNANSRQFADGEYALTIFDECHRLPAETFSRLALIRTKYRLGLSASPHREDGRENYIFALTGKPVGLNWLEYMKESKRTYHPIFVHIANSREAKLRKLSELLNPKKKTFIFCDSIDLGKEISRRHDVPFVHGESSDRMQTIMDNKVVAISRVGDEGVSAKDLEQIIEIDFLGGSRRQELQRTGRLMHSEEAGRHDIIMTEKELNDHGKRIWALQERGFTVKIMQ